MHGGDIYRNNVKYDFSVNVNPLGMPEEMKNAILAAMDHLDEYPDPEAEMLRNRIAARIGVPAECIIPGNGASEIFMAAVHALEPSDVLLAAPSFSGYEYSVKSVGKSRIRYFMLEEERDFSLEESGIAAGESLNPADHEEQSPAQSRKTDYLNALEELGKTQKPMAFLACPNNPNGRLVSPDYLCEILKTCEKNGIRMILDECFLDFSENVFAYRKMLAEENCPHLIRVGAYTKICAIPGVRLGYAVVQDKELRDLIHRQLPEWNLSAFAQAAGSAEYDECEWMRKTWEHLKAERSFLLSVFAEPSIAANIKVYPSDANYMLLKTEIPLYSRMLERGILIRDCSDYPGLSKGYYRIAVKSRQENEALASALREICGG
ncbi:MAG: aminotransferase class I/II-fold pyridoxal phosphate-dependent enzyme [Lachnospiraceae bacterium]|nr:aminotransferase class I/II-fold pyridoxal phosphate-dependent enzyme [Lachnospiraceae bacterium]